MNAFADNKSTQEVLTNQAMEQERSIEAAVDLFISQLQSKATLDQQRRLLALLEEIDSNSTTIAPVVELKYA